MSFKFPAQSAQPAPNQIDLKFQQAMALHGAGRLAEARVLCEAVVKKAPRHCDAFHLLGIIAYQTGHHKQAVAFIDKAIKIFPTHAGFHSNRGLPLQELGQLEAAIASYDKALALKSDYPEAHCNRANALKELKRFAEALAGYEKAISLRPNFADAFYNRGITFQDMGEAEAALASYDRAIALRLEHAEIHYNRGNVLHELGRLSEAVSAYDRALAFQSGFADAHCNRGNVLEALSNHSAALASYDRALALQPNSSAFHCNRGNVLQKLRKLDEAVASYDRALALEPGNADAHFNRAIALQKLDRLAEAVASYDAAIALKPGHPDLYYNRGLALKDLKREEEALADQARVVAINPDYTDAKRSVFWIHFARLEDSALVEALSADIMRKCSAEEAVSLSAKAVISNFRVLHDMEQAAYLLSEGYDLDGMREAHDRLQDIHVRDLDAGGGTAVRQVPVSEAEIAAITRFRLNLLRYATPRSPDACLNPANDWRAVEDQYFDSKPEIIHIDNLLSQEALAELRKFCLVSTVWRTEYGNQYLGAFAEDGFVSPLHFQIAVELRQKMPRVFGPHKLEHLWGFKYSARMDSGINVHADFARVNLNFWVTPDEANLDPATGGLVVYDKPSPPSWSFMEYNTGEEAIYDFLKTSGAGSRRVPYRCNRAVLFNSNLFHETDTLHFKEGYANRRVNVTYLFGKGLKTN